MSEDIKVTDGTVLETLNNKVDIDFNNVASNSIGFAKYSTEVTNCLLEVPQRIKYTLENGTLTIKAGSVVIVPYGTEDKTSQYPKGATFLHDNFKVCDTQFADGKFFVWAEFVNTTNYVSGISAGVYNRFVTVDISNNTIDTHIDSVSGTTPEATKNYTVSYDTSTNLVGWSSDSTTLNYYVVHSLPLMIVTNVASGYLMGSIQQVFNGMGYIGSTVWVDKGVKGLIPNGRNEDRTLRNIEYTTENIQTNNIPNSNDWVLFLNGQSSKTGSMYECYPKYYIQGYSFPTMTTDNQVFYHIGENQLYYKQWDATEFTKISACKIGGFDTKLKNAEPFRAVDYSELGSIISKTNPDYSRAIQIQPNYTCPSDGYVVLQTVVVSSGNTPTLYINNVLVSHFHYLDSPNERWGGGMFKVSKGDYLAWGYWACVLFIPEKGV